VEVLTKFDYNVKDKKISLDSQDREEKECFEWPAPDFDKSPSTLYLWKMSRRRRQVAQIQKSFPPS